MNHRFRFGLTLAILVSACLAVGRASAQPAAGPARPAAAGAVPVGAVVRPVAAAPGAAARAGGWVTPVSPFRRLAPGVMQNVIPERSALETVEPHDVTELLYVDDTFDFAKDVPFRHEVWMFEIKYKPVRMIWADIPGPDARMLRKQIWYMVYQVTNPGKVFRFVEQEEDKVYKEDIRYKLVTEDKPLRFTPVFTLESHNALRKEVEGSARAYIEQCIPIVLPAIRAREDKNRDFLTSEQMPLKEIGVGETVWGVVTWQDIDPNNVWFSVYVEGLTNAYTFTDDPAKYAAIKQAQRDHSKTATAPFREIRTKVLKLNFWRPGDEFTVKENQVRLGVPELPGGPPARPASEWVWWKTFPAPAKTVPPAN